MSERQLQNAFFRSLCLQLFNIIYCSNMDSLIDRSEAVARYNRWLKDEYYTSICVM